MIIYWKIYIIYGGENIAHPSCSTTHSDSFQMYTLFNSNYAELIQWLHHFQSNKTGSSHHQLWESRIVEVKHTASIHSAHKLAYLSKKKKKKEKKIGDQLKLMMDSKFLLRKQLCLCLRVMITLTPAAAAGLPGSTAWT